MHIQTSRHQQYLSLMAMGTFSPTPAANMKPARLLGEQREVYLGWQA